MNDPQFSTDDYVAAFRKFAIAPYHLRMLQANYHAPDHTLTATKMSRALGYSKYHAANLHYGILGRLVAENIGWRPIPPTTVYVLCTFKKPGREWHWIMRPQVAKALERLGWIEGENPINPEEVEISASIYEGAVRKVTVNAYERSAAAREACILHYGCRCAACGVNLAEKYGVVAQGLIHVHHLFQLSKINAKYSVNPVRDLRPVCPNCHAVIHSKTPPFKISEIARMLHSRIKK
jgi:5-methylcytosine-specific restriction enzyme A